MITAKQIRDEWRNRLQDGDEIVLDLLDNAYRSVYEFEQAQRKLRAQAEHIRDRMANLVADLDERGADANPNTLGEMQGRGSELDRLCGEFGILKAVAERSLAMLAGAGIEIS